MQEYLDVRDGTHDTPKYVDKGIPLVTSKNLYTKRLDLSNIKFISEKDHFEISKRSHVERNDILFAMIGSIGNPVIVDIEPNFSIKNVALIKYYIKELCVPHFILFFLEYATKEFKDNSDGAVQSFVSLTKLRMKEFPLPPLEEQKEIVRVVETLFKEIEQLEQLTVERISLKEDFVTSALNQLTTNNAKKEWAFLQEHFKSFFNETTNIKKLRETVLQLAVQGKLTADWREQRSLSGAEIEDASILLKRIQKEKAQLIKDKKIKKEKPLPPITKGEIPYELPEGWVCCRLGDLGKAQTGTTPPTKDPENYGTYIPFLGPADISNNAMQYPIDGLSIDGLKKGRLIESNSLMMVCIGGSMGKCNINRKDVSCNQQINILTPIYSPVEYIKTICQSPYFQKEVLERSTGSATPMINKNKWLQIPVPIPPLEEQKAIVQKVNALMGLCDSLEQEVQQSQKHSEQLMQSCLREVFEGEINSIVN